VAAIPKVGGTKDVNLEKIRKLAPTHVVVNIDENEKPTADALAEFVPNIVVTHPLGPRDNLALARLLGGIFLRGQQAEHGALRFEQRIRGPAGRAQGTARDVLYCIWQDPWMSISHDTYIARMLAEIGWQHAGPGDPARYPVSPGATELVAGIDGVLLSTEPYRFTERTRMRSKSRSASRSMWSMGK
jgi:ABC-type Fe3+-hydroxamate transport system substrate-binding protein